MVKVGTFKHCRCRGSKNELKIKCEHCWNMSSAPLTWSDYNCTESWTVKEMDKVKKFGSERSSALYWSHTLTLSDSVCSACCRNNISNIRYVKNRYVLHHHGDSREHWSKFIWQRSLYRNKRRKKENKTNLHSLQDFAILTEIIAKSFE